jgi:arylsulfatase A-like enzyme
VKALVEEIDLLPTVLELVGLRVPPGVQGQSLFNAKPRRAVHSEYSNIKMIRTPEWKLVHYLHAPHGELYNLKEDPHELYNRFADPGAANACREMQSQLADWLIDSHDPLLPPIKA